MKTPWSNRKGQDAAASPAATVSVNVPDVDVVDATEAAQHEGSRSTDFALFRDKRPAAMTPLAEDKPVKKGLFARRVKPTDIDADVSDVEARPSVLPEEEASSLVEEVSSAPAAAAPVPEQAEAEPVPAPKKGWFRKKPKAEQRAEAPAPTKRKVNLPKYEALPVQVVVGYLPEVSARDATEYAMGIAEKHFSQPGLTYYFVTEYGSGFAYEVHEGGDGKAYLPAILNYFDSQGEYQPEEHVSGVIATATRKVEVLRQRAGLVGLVLPAGSEKEQSDWLRATKLMTPVINRQRKFLVTGFVVFVTGMLAMATTAVFFRLQGYLPPMPPKVETITLTELPRSQWSRIEALPADSSIRALRYRSDKWQDIELENSPLPSGEPEEGAEPPNAASTQAEAPTVSQMKTSPMVRKKP